MRRMPSFNFFTCFTVPYRPNIDFSIAEGDNFVRGWSEYVGFSTMNFGKFSSGFGWEISWSSSECMLACSSSLLVNSVPVRLRDKGVFCLVSIMGVVRLGYCFTPYQRLWLYNGAPLVAFYDTLGIRRTYFRLKPPASSRGIMGVCWFIIPASHPPRSANKGDAKEIRVSSISTPGIQGQYTRVSELVV